jgi:hypothetical protein
MEEKKYLVQIEGNEALLDRFIEAINDGTCGVAEEYPSLYKLPSGETFLNSRVVEYFLSKEPFLYQKTVAFCEKIRKLGYGFSDYSYALGEWIKEKIQKPYFKKSGVKYQEIWTIKPDIDASKINPEILSFMCYVAVCHIKYGASYETVTANEYFGMVSATGSKEVEILKKYGTQQISIDLTEYKDQNIVCKANDVFATIKIKINNECEEAYRAALAFTCRLLENPAFPSSYAIEFSSKIKNTLPIKGLLKASVHTFFANAVQYPNLHDLIEKYAHLAMKADEWYNNIDDEFATMPSTFAVLALGLESEKYFDLIVKFMETIDGDHSDTHTKFTAAFVEKYGLTRQTVPVYLACILSVQQHPIHKIFTEKMANQEALETLLDHKNNFVAFLEHFWREDKGGSPVDEELANYTWETVIYATFGKPENYPSIIKKAKPELKPLYERLFEK